MEEKITIFKVKYQGEPKITVLNAGATEKDIRFYLNHDQFIRATYTGDEEITIEVDEKQTEKKERRKMLILYNPCDILSTTALPEPALAGFSVIPHF